jgi:hypothetical protein
MGQTPSSPPPPPPPPVPAVEVRVAAIPKAQRRVRQEEPSGGSQIRQTAAAAPIETPRYTAETQAAAVAAAQASATRAAQTAAQEAAERAAQAAAVALQTQREAAERTRVSDVQTATVTNKNALGRKANLQLELATLGALKTTLQEQNVRLSQSLADKKEIEGKIQVLRVKLSDMSHATETYEKEFLDRKSSAPTYYTGFQTLQDFALLVFFLGYALLSFLLMIFIYRTARIGGTIMAASTFVVMSIGAIMLMAAIRQYG